MENYKRLISDDTLYLDEEDIFIAKLGKNIDINSLISLAKEKNPKYIITNTLTNHSNVIYFKNLKKIENILIQDYKVKPIIIGVTGTNGKTSTTTIIYQILKKLNQKVMLVGTNGVYFNDLHFKTRNTTPSKLSILYLINKYLDNNSYLVIELSSQSYQRIKDFKIDYLIYTNLSNEHLDYHKTMNKYFKAKLKIINLLKDKHNLLINTDDKYGQKLIKKYPYAIKYSLNDLKIISNNPIEFFYEDNKINSSLSSNFNIYNLYSSYRLLTKLFDKEKIIETIKEIKEIDGRNNLYKYQDNYVVIDYAHTPESFENIISYYNSLEHHNLYILFGFGGNKDKIKRSQMLEIALKYSENIIISEDNSRYEPFIEIIKSALKVDASNLIIIEERKEAIRYAISKLEHNDYLLILGKGNEEYLLKKGQVIPYSDKEEILKWIQ